MYEERTAALERLMEDRLYSVRVVYGDVKRWHNSLPKKEIILISSRYRIDWIKQPSSIISRHFRADTGFEWIFCVNQSSTMSEPNDCISKIYSSSVLECVNCGNVIIVPEVKIFVTKETINKYEGWGPALEAAYRATFPKCSCSLFSVGENHE